MKYVYPAIFHSEGDKILVDIPDLRGAHTFGSNLLDALTMAKDAAEMWLSDAEDNKEFIPIPTAISDIHFHYADGFVNFVCADTNEYRRVNAVHAIKRHYSTHGLAIRHWRLMRHFPKFRKEIILKRAIKTQAQMLREDSD